MAEVFAEIRPLESSSQNRDLLEGPSGFRPVMWVATLSAVPVLVTPVLLWAASPASGARPSIFRHLFLAHEGSGAIGAAAVLLSALVLSARRLVPAWTPPVRSRTFYLGLLGIVLLALSGFTLVAYRAYPLSMDEFAPLVQARIFSRGVLRGSVPPQLVARTFPYTPDFFTATPSGEIISSYLPVHAALLIPFTLAGVEWFLNPLVGTLTLLVLWLFTRRLGGPAAADWAALLLLSSPVFVVTSTSLYSMPLHLLFNLAFAYLLTRGTAGADLSAGIIGALALNLHQPVPHALFAAPWMLQLLRARCWRRLALVGSGYLWLGLPLLVGWLSLRGTMLQPSAGPSGAWEMFRTFYASVVGQPGVEGLVDQALAWDRFFLWLVPVAPAVAVLSIRRDLAPPVKALWASALLTGVGYLFYPRNQGHGWGYRYMYPALGVLPIAAGLRLAQPTASNWLRRLALASALGSLMILVPLRLIQVQRFIDAHLAQLPSAGPSAQADVVFIRPGAGYFAGNLIENDPFLERRPWLLLGQGEEDERRFMSKTFPAAQRVGGTEVGSVWKVSP